jgi:sugar (pentulose or hexulose) kinase
LIPNLPPGAKEQHPHSWREAAASAIRQALRQAKAVAAEVKAIGVSGQQHGFVPLDKSGEVIRPAKLWCDTSTPPSAPRSPKTRRAKENHQSARQCRTARLHCFENSLAEKS